MQIYASTDIGQAREMNQDYYYVQTEPIKLYILADGMGGYNGGEIASKLAVESVQNYINNNFSTIQLDKEGITKLILNAIEYANMVVYEKSKSDTNLREMGTTLEVCLIYNNKIYIGHIGDSRVYRIRKNIIRKLTTDHSYVEKLVKDGTITREESYHHPKKNMLMKALGCSAFAEPDVLIKGFIKDDIILMCSDGLSNLLMDEEIYDIVTRNNDNIDKILIQKANEKGGFDNITAIVIKNN